MIHKTTKLAIFAFLTFPAISSPAWAGSAVYLGTRVAQSRQVSIDKIDHAAWDAITRKYVDTNGMVNYRGLKASAADMQALARYLNLLSTANPSLPASPDATLAFWINAYNAVTVHGILREYPTTSIRNHTAKLWGYNIWKDLQLYVGGKPYSLDQIEHEVLRKKGDPRIHFAIVCASIGCPRLLNEAYVPDRLQEQLQLNAKDFFARSQNFRYDPANRRMQLSSILDWFGEDFGGNQAAQLKRIAEWLPSQTAQAAARQNAVSVSYLDYNWNLNSQ
ncbi:DUF547 domain-containing protein [Rosistilla oblonga]|uniref:DUF547 domain-containing protein n=1 Tax=Rosistilla oblonga TaxID=2527990 RepID=A0A518J1P5_9BACT|nr:DUF547 domain-containing protein [Rosistilla oblonga]QDV59251.1 hypothetical protein Mal33_52790 [Rosistilla oblonga]